jgi:gas vesicle protein
MKYKLLVSLLFPIIVFAQKPASGSERKPIIQKDTIYIIKQMPDDKMVKYYQEILEKTNAQLSLWWNPYGVLIGLLGVLFTILTIIAAVVIYRQSKEYKELINESLSKHETVLGQLITERNQQLKNIETNLSNTITDYKEKLKSATDDNKKEINSLIKTLEEQKESIDTQIHASYVVPEQHDQFLTASSLYGIQKKPHRCSKCGYGYFVQSYPYDVGMTSVVLGIHGYGSKTITCPKCGNVEIYN